MTAMDGGNAKNAWSNFLLYFLYIIATGVLASREILYFLYIIKLLTAL
jgi:hypothetical protein